MKTLRYISLFLLCMPTLLAKAQDLTNAQERMMNMDVLYLMEDYSLYSNLVLEEDKEYFLSLFNDTTTQIYNDLLGISSSPTLSVSQYADKLMEIGGGSSTIKIKNITHEDPYFSDGLWYMYVKFNKWLYYMINCDLQFDSEEYFKADHELTAVISWNQDTRECKITALDGTIDSEIEMLPEEYWVFRNTNPIDTLLFYDGQPLHFDRFGQSFIKKDEMPEGPLSPRQAKKITPLSLTQKHFTYPFDSDVHLHLDYEDESCDLLNMRFIPKRWRFKLYADITYDKFYTIESTYNKASYSSSAQEAGFDFGYVFPTDKKNKWSFYFGASVRQSELNFEIPSVAYLYRTKQDIDNDEYYRAYFLNNMLYTTQRTEIGIPLYFDWEGKFNNRLSIYMDFGAKAYLSISGPKTSFSANYTTKGLYTKYDNLVLHSGSFSGSETINGFVTNKKISSSGLESKKNYDGLENILNSLSPNIDALAGIGFRLRVLNNTFLEVGCRYQYNVYSHIKCNGSVNIKEIDYNAKLENHKFSNNTLSYESNVPIRYVKSGVTGNEVISNVTDYFKKLSTSALYINAGIVIRY